MLGRWRQARRPVRLAILGATLVAFVVVATGVIALLSARPALGAQSTLTILGGSVSIREGAADFSDAADGQLVGPGVTIRTGPGSNAVLTYVDGTTVTVEPDSELVIEQLEFTESGDLIAVMQQTLGRTWHVVQYRLGPTGRYEVRTPAATAAVRGTAFTVDVDSDGGMDLVTTEGVVAAGNADATVDVGADQTTSVQRGGAPAQPGPAPAPQAVVRIALDPTQNAVAVDAKGRAVGLQNGIPLRYVPGSKVEVIDGRLVLTIPTNEPGRISTIVQRDDGSDDAVDIETEVVARGAVVSRTTERRAVDPDGTAKGGVVLTTSGVVVLPDGEAKEVGAPIVGRAPERRAGASSARESVRATPVPTPERTPRQRGGQGPATPGVFLGAFQPFQAGGGGAVVAFTSEPPSELLPPPPPSRAGCAAFARDCAGKIKVEGPRTPASGEATSFGATIVIPANAPDVFTTGRRGGASGSGAQGVPPGCVQTPFGISCAATPAERPEKEPETPGGGQPETPGGGQPDRPDARPGGPGQPPPGRGAGGGGGQAPKSPPPAGGFIPAPLPIPQPLGGGQQPPAGGGPGREQPKSAKPSPSAATAPIPKPSPSAKPKGPSGGGNDGAGGGGGNDRPNRGGARDDPDKGPKK